MRIAKSGMTMPLMAKGRYKQIMKTFGTRLRQARERKGYKSAQQFAAILGLEPHTYRKYERGQSEANYETLTRMCELLDITPNDLFPSASKSDREGNPSSAAA